jgi:hypothetical protein
MRITELKERPPCQAHGGLDRAVGRPSTRAAIVNTTRANVSERKESTRSKQTSPDSQTVQ